MTPSQHLLEEELKTLPESLLKEILDFVLFLKSKANMEKISDTALASESSLAKDWLRPEEDEAWKNL